MVKIITTYRSPNHSKVIRKKPSRVVLHHTAGYFEGDLSWLCNPKANASANYLIAKNGNVYELVPIQYAAWHTGAAVPGWGNADTIGIEISNFGDGKDPFTDEQISSTAELLKRLNIPKDCVRDHKAICIPRGRKNDLAPNFSWEKLWKYAYGAQIQGQPDTASRPASTLTFKSQPVTREKFANALFSKVLPAIFFGPRLNPQSAVTRKEAQVLVERAYQHKGKPVPGLAISDRPSDPLTESELEYLLERLK
jgi:N-acetylmuramoyl-L-alanine amidase